MIPFRHGIATFLLISTVFALQDTAEVKRKDSKKAFIYSLFPGMGQAYNGKWIKSALVIGLEASAYVSWQENLKKYRDYNSNDYPLNRHRYLEKRNKFAWWMGIIYIYAMIDAIVDAHLHSFDDLMESSLDQENSKGNKYAE
tara:strand:+ start:2463 stop:2888 length:426 start_codon:yes stop_codon:yes gene_type:complete